MRGRVFVATVAALAVAPLAAWGADGGADDAGAAAAAPADAGNGATESVAGCVEHVPPGAQRPTVRETFPARGLSGYATTLRLEIEHGKGEKVLPRGLDLQSEGEAAKVLKEAQFVLPNQDGGAGATLTDGSTSKADRAMTVLDLPVVPLPSDPGRHALVLPPVPVAVARANGEIVTVCTHPHTIVVEDPIASTPDAKPKPNPPPRAQREEWTTLKWALAVLAAGIALGALLAYAIRRWRARPKPVPPPPPPRPAWEVALERLDEVRHAGLLEQGRFGEYFDRVSDAVRGYLGARYGFDGLESTTDEIVAALQRATLHGVALPEVIAFLQECDLVKFANWTPTLDECTRALHDGERIVRMTMPRSRAFDGSEVPA